MIRLRHKLFIYALRVFDQALLISTLLLTIDLTGRYNNTGSLLFLLQNHYQPRSTLGFAVICLLSVLLFNLLVHYETNRLKTLRTQLFDVFKANSAAAFLLMVVGTVFSFKRLNNEVVLIFWLTTCGLGMLSRVALKNILMFVRRSGYNNRHLLIFGFNEQARGMAKKIDDAPVLGYKIAGFISENETDTISTSSQRVHPAVIGHFKDLKSILENEPIDEIMICLPFLEKFGIITEVVHLAQDLGVVVRLFPDDSAAKILSMCHIEQFDGHSIVTMFREQLLLQLLGKRVMDFSCSFLLLVLLSPLLLFVAVCIKLTSPGPIFFIQPRVGMNKRSFKLLKFRSMYVDAEKRKAELAHLNEMDGPVFKIKNDPRITPVGRFIRKASIDELPQLFNVLTGHMSLVGPRPPLLSEVNRYEWLFQKRLSIKPGITCIWQISGRNEVTFKQWMEMDKQYIDNWSLWLDIEILLKTLPAVLFRKGAS